MLDIEPYVPLADLKQLSCLNRFQLQLPLSTPFANGGVVYATVYSSMSGIYWFDFFIDIIISGSFMHIMSIRDGFDGNQTVYWDRQPVYTRHAFIVEFRPTIL
jgi:hypothetical protein